MQRLPPQLRFLPASAARIIAILIAVNVIVWIAVAVVLRSHPLLASTAVLAYTFGLRHALDADHICAIDLLTRRLVATGSKPVTIGMWFSIGHSTIVVIICIVVAATSGALEERFAGFQKVGGIIGTGVSAGVLILLGAGNAWILVKLVQSLRKILRAGTGETSAGENGESSFKLEGGGIMVRVFKKLFNLIDRPWKMYPLGVMFGLGFDTSSEIALLGLASIQAAQGTSIWLILIFPVLFTAGMCLLDTTDGALMMTLYTSTTLARDTVAILYYSIVLTGVTVVIATCIGTIQLLSLISNAASPSGKFWDGVNSASDHFDIIGGAICGAFVLFGCASVAVYGPWRRRIERRHRQPDVELEIVHTSVGESKVQKVIQVDS